MNEGIDYMVAVLLFAGFVYALVRQIKHTFAIANAEETVNYKRTLLGNALSCIALIGFLVSFGLNLLVVMRFIESSTITSSNISASCFIFLATFFIAKFIITPKFPQKSSLSV